MRFSTIVLLGLSLFTFTACNSSSDGGAPAAKAPTTVANAINEDGTLSPSGDAFSTSLVVSQDFCAGDACAASDDPAWDDVFAAHDGLEEDFATLASIDKVIYTDAGTYDLYAGDTLLMTLAPNGDTWAVSATSVDLDITDIMLQSTAGTEQEQSTLNSISFALESCVSEQPQEQEQEQGKEEEQGKDEEQVQGKRGQEQEQGKEETQEKEQEEVKECDTYHVTLFLEQEEVKEQEQGKDETVQEGKDEEQGKDETVQEGKDETVQEGKDEEQGKDETVQEGKDQTQDQEEGKDTADQEQVASK